VTLYHDLVYLDTFFFTFQRSSWSSGLGLGGTTTLNLFIHLRGHKKDYDNWARVTGDPAWSWNQVLPFFKKHEDYEQGGDGNLLVS